jgi:hypothetical protein
MKTKAAKKPKASAGLRSTDGLGYINVNIDGHRATVAAAHYIKAKTKQLREFGYPTLTEETVETQLRKILAKQELDVIGMFMEGEIVVP